MSSFKTLTCFKSYDVRGKIGEEFNEEIAYSIGRATVQSLNAKSAVVGYDARGTSSSLARAVAQGICEAGADVLDLGLAGTEEIYSAVSEFSTGAGIVVTASHNPIDYNGMKIVKGGSKPLSTQEFVNIKNLAEKQNFVPSEFIGRKINKKEKARKVYLEKIMQFVDLKSLNPLKIVINSGNGAAGPTLDTLTAMLEQRGVKTNFVFVNHEPDPLFPNGIPNPILEENRSSTANFVLSEKAKFGVAFDGDFDRCFLFDEYGQFISGEYVVGLLAEVFLKKEKGAVIVHDPRVVWNTLDVVRKFGGYAVASRTGHAYVKASMREAGAVYGGEMSAHHYFRDFFHCDSGMIPWLLIWELLSQSNSKLSDIISKRISSFPSSGEINFSVFNAADSLQRVKDFYFSNAAHVDESDGLSISFENWRFNIRKSNTEPLVRLNIETKNNKLLLRKKTKELTDLIRNV